MSQRVTTAGMYLCWAAETTAGERPTSGYTVLPEIKSMPDLNQEPNNIDSTTLLETEYETSEPGLKSVGTLTYGANMTDDLEDIVEDLIEAQDTAAAAGKRIWYAEVNPKLKKATFFAGKVSNINFSEASVNGMGDTSIYITASTGLLRYPKPSITAESQAMIDKIQGKDTTPATVSAYSTTSKSSKSSDVEV